MSENLLSCAIASIVSFVVCADVVKGRVCLIPFPSIEEFAQAYDMAKSADIRQVASELVTAKFNAKGVVDVANMAVERIKAAIKRKTGKDIQCPAPLTDFPVSTNNVIYVPDVVLR